MFRVLYSELLYNNYSILYLFLIDLFLQPISIKSRIYYILSTLLNYYINSLLIISPLTLSLTILEK
jgi:hypothetical protein